MWSQLGKATALAIMGEGHRIGTGVGAERAGAQLAGETGLA